MLILLIYDIFRHGLFLSRSTLICELTNGDLLVLHLFPQQFYSLCRHVSLTIIIASPTLRFHRTAQYMAQVEKFSLAL